MGIAWQEEMRVGRAVAALNSRGYVERTPVGGRAVAGEVGFEAVVGEIGFEAVVGEVAVQLAAAAAAAAVAVERQRRMALGRGVEYNPAMRLVGGMMLL